MKKLILLLCFFGFVKAYAQDISDYDYNYDKVRIVDSNQVIVAELQPYKSAPKTKDDRFYFWYNSNAIQSTQGGFTGQLLNGHYTAFYADKRLKEEGDFKKGLKQGVWKTWNEKGALTSSVTWDDGLLLTGPKPPFWKKLPLISKKSDQTQTATPASKP